MIVFLFDRLLLRQRAPDPQHDISSRVREVIRITRGTLILSLESTRTVCNKLIV